MTENSLEKLLNQYLQSSGSIGGAVMLMQNGEIQTAAAGGERKYKSGVPTTVKDKWHIGSITKAFTATLLARLVEKRELDWHSRIIDLFETTEFIHPDWSSVTVHHLLTHTSGAAANISHWTNLKKPQGDTPRMRARHSAALKSLSKPLLATPGLMFRYSNLGYIIAGVIAETIRGQSWEALLANEVLEPLGIENYGFGPPRDHNDPTGQPRGHYRLLGRPFSSLQDNSPIMGPAGTLHMPLAELMKFGQEHLQGLKGNGKLLSAENHRVLHQPMLANYACGWVLREKPGDDVSTVYWHDGSNSIWYALLSLIPERNSVLALAFNDAFAIEQKGADIEKLATEIVHTLS